MNIQVLEILGLGAVGLAFLMAFLTYRLVKGIDEDSGEEKVETIKKYMSLVLALCIIGALPQVLKIMFPDNPEPAPGPNPIVLEKASNFDRAVTLNCDYRWLNCRTNESTYARPANYTPARPVESFLCDFCE